MGTFLLAAAAIYSILVGALYLGQNRLLFLPNVAGKEISATPANVGLAYEDVAIETRDGVSLHGWFVPAAGSDTLLLFFHGNAGNISHRLDSIRLFHGLGLNVLIVDYGGYGRSGGKPSERGTYNDAEAAWSFATSARAFPQAKIVIFGRSLGGSVAAWLAQHANPGALIIESSFTSVPDLAAQIYPFFPVRLLAKLDFNTRRYVQNIACPVLIVHSRDDGLIPFTHGQQLFEAAPEPKAFLEIRGDHNGGFLLSGTLYTQGLEAFLRTNLAR